MFQFKREQKEEERENNEEIGKREKGKNSCSFSTLDIPAHVATLVEAAVSALTQVPCVLQVGHTRATN